MQVLLVDPGCFEGICPILVLTLPFLLLGNGIAFNSLISEGRRALYHKYIIKKKII